MVVWDLSELITGNIEDELTSLQKQSAHIARWTSKLAKMSRDDFSQLLKEFEQFHAKSAEVFSYVHLKYTENTTDSANLALSSKTDQINAKISNELRFFSLWWKELSAKRAKELGAGRDDISYYLESIRKYRPHTLTNEQEKIITLKDTTGNATLMNVYNAITNAFSYELIIKGKKKSFTREQLSHFIYGSDAQLRKQAYDVLLGKFKENRAVLGEVYRATAMDWYNENITLRKYASPISPRNLNNDVPDNAVHALLDVCRSNVNVFQEYFRKKAIILGIKKMRRYDVYASPKAKESIRSFDEAKKLVLDVFGKYSATMQEHASRIFHAQHVHSEVMRAKRDGAFCASTSPKMLPYVLLSFTGKLSDVSTLAHEMGHAVHSMMASEHSVFTFQASLPLAETASIFSETLLIRELLKLSSKKERQALLLRELDHIYASVQRQAFFVDFEIRAHGEIANGASTNDLDALYLEHLKTQFGSVLNIAPIFKYEYLCIPHIFQSPFYCYAYAFGNLLALSLVGLLDAEGLSAMKKIERVFAWGGATSPEHVLAEIGIDISSSQFWQSGFDVIRHMVKDLE